MDKNCAIARDLMPPVIDNVASQESKAFVEEHTAACQPCAQAYQDMRADIRGAAPPAGAEAAGSFQAAVSQLKKTLGWKRIRAAALAVLITAAAVLAGYAGYSFLFERTDLRVVPNEDYTVHLFKTESYSAYIIPEYHKRYDGVGMQSTFDENSGVLYIYWTSAIIPLAGGGASPIWYPDTFMRLSMANGNVLTTADGAVVREIRQGTENNYDVIYHAGDAIPPINETVYAYIRQREFFADILERLSQTMAESGEMMARAEQSYQEYLDQWGGTPSAAPEATPAQ